MNNVVFNYTICILRFAFCNKIKPTFALSLPKCAFFLFCTFLFSFFTFHLGAQGLTKYGESTSSSANFVDKNGKIVGSPALGRYGGTPVLVAIGDNYGGGKVAYILQSGDPGYDAYAQHGLIAAPSDQSIGAEWGCSGTTISGADGTAIGTGNQNTIDIMAGCSTAGIAARLCGDLVLGGYSDWYLPSKDELNKLYLQKVNIGGFLPIMYWNSSETSSSTAYYQSFTNGSSTGGPDKSITTGVRAVRSF
jgi:hypothetical protein